MAQVIKSISGEVVIVSDLKQPANVQPAELQQQVVVVENFLQGEQTDRIEFVLDERFRERAIQTLIERGEGITSTGAQTNRDLAGFVEIDLQSFVEEDERTPTYLSSIMKSPVYRRDVAKKVVKTEFKEFV